MAARYNRTNYSSYLNEEPMPDATSEKEQGNEYFKQKKFAEAIECYSRSVAMSPTAVAFANRAMAYLKLRRFEEAESDCTEALNLDDRYVKAYSRRITARKGLGKIKEAMDDAEFAVSVDANNPELRKQYSEIKALLMEKMAKRSSVQAKHTISEFDKAGDRKNTTSHAPSDPQKDSFMEVDSPGRAAAGIRELSAGVSKGGSGVILKDNNMQQSRDAKQKPGPEISVQELASRAASRYMSSTVKSVKTPKTAYDFEVSWGGEDDGTSSRHHHPQPGDSNPNPSSLEAPLEFPCCRCCFPFSPLVWSRDLAGVWMKERKPAAPSALARILATCASQAKDYGRCIAAKVPEIEHNMCSKEFLALRQCMQTAVKNKA